MYHAVGNDCWGEESLFVKPEELEKQLQYLSENGYETIFFEDLAHIEQYEKPVMRPLTTDTTIIARICCRCCKNTA